MYIDVVTLIREALLHSGVDESILSDFDGHSTIALDFDSYPSLLISDHDGKIWIWSQLCEHVLSILQHHAAAIQEKLIDGCQFAMTGQLQISINDGMLELKGLVHPDYLTSGLRFADALDEFFQQQEAFLEIIH